MWNENIKPGDKVYHLGDVVMGNNQEEWLEKHMPKLHGQKRLILGNYDNVFKLVKYFKKIDIWRGFKEYKLLFTHVPVHPSTIGEHRWDGECKCVHGHVHKNSLDDPRYINVSAEVINYTPVNIDSLVTF